ncbi:hypothetical protein K2173_009528 [Erythroxylum novogranatense]|uniref:poly(ADP-ribose) glycohydrolase n=1 Tax=Erythroxylum novogranatense TaxID=1862640 RepID=A0AAV8U458_9ROSI|nr:hypothetical protein K2173_009528 [Erythroxylum novogranatense]
METREDLGSIVSLLPLLIRSSNVFWPSQAVELLKTLSKGPAFSNVNTGETLFVAISDLRGLIPTLPANRLAPFSHEGYALFFDELMSRAESAKWFGEVVPALANLLLRFPSLLEAHYQHADDLFHDAKIGRRLGLRLLPSQKAGMVLLSQELIGALLACAFFCLFPVADRAANCLPMINFDNMFESLYESYSEAQENKIKCIMHYFERICCCLPKGFVSFERKVLPFEELPLHNTYPKPEFWSKSDTSLCPFEVHSSGFIEDHANGAVEVDFANKYLGGGALNRGCVQEEIRFMISPELIAGMLFLPCMEDNEAIEVVGAERFSNYIGYASSFRFSGDYVDNKDVDNFKRRKTRIIAIDALSSPGMRQYKLKYLLRETNKAFCGFFILAKSNSYGKPSQMDGIQGNQHSKGGRKVNCIPRINFLLNEAPSTFANMEMNEVSTNGGSSYTNEKGQTCLDQEDDIGVATGNWGCGAFRGDPQLKTIIQWLAASQALRPFISYYKFGIEALEDLDQVSKWILAHEWTVGELWNMLVEYSSQRSSEETKISFFRWLIPSLIDHHEGLSV